MTIIPCISGVITDNVQNAFAVAVGRARSLEGQYRKEALEIEDVTVLIDVRGDKVYIIVSNELTGVFTHPRSGPVELLTHYEWQSYNGFGALLPQKSIHGVAGGWQDGKTPLTTEYIYPLVDSDNASYLVAKDADGLVGEFAGSTGNYGNLYWWNGNEEEPVFLSWKGTPTRHFRLSSSTSIPGLSTQETVSPGLYEDTPYFTTFTEHVYQNGSIYLTAPRWNWPYSGSANCLVLGAMADSDSVYIVVQSDRTRVPKYVTYFSDGYRIASDVESDKQTYLSSHAGVTIAFEKEYPSQGGIYTMLWKQGGPVDGWSFIGEYNTGRQGLPWFAPTDGSYFTNTLGYKFLVTGEYLEIDTNSSGTYTSTEFACGDMQVTSTYSSKKFFEGDKFGSVALSFKSQSSKTFPDNVSKEYTGSFPMLVDPEGPDMPRPMRYEHSIYATQQAVVGQFFRSGIVGGDGSVTETYSGFSVNEDGIITSVNGCGSGSVTATDACGDTYTRPVMLTSGMWLYDPAEHPGPLVYTWADTTHQEIIEGRMVIESAQQSCGNATTIGFKMCVSSPGGNICIDNHVYTYSGTLGTAPTVSAFTALSPYYNFYDYNECVDTNDCWPTVTGAFVRLTLTCNIHWVVTKKQVGSWVCP